MGKFGLVGPSYQSQSVNADCQICMNWYVERVESGQGKAPMVLYRTPGLKAFASLSQMANVREYFYFNGRLFVIAETLYPSSKQVLWEVMSNASAVQRGNLGIVGSKPSMAANNASQLLISSGGQVFLFDLGTNLLSEINTTDGTALQGKVDKVGFSDGYFIAHLTGTSRFQISGLLDGTAWDPTDIAQVLRFPDNVLTMTVDHTELIMWGPKQSLAYFDSGNPDFPFDPVPGAFIEQGIIAIDSIAKLDNTLFWIGGDERGGAMAYRAEGYRPVRISTHAQENAWQKYSTVSDAIAYSYQERGHTFWVLYFPTASKTWAYDVASGLWHERSYLDGTAHRSQCHVFAFGKHLVGDWKTGTIYEMSMSFLDDAGTNIKRVRRAPHISDEQKWVFHSKLQIDSETGLGPQPPLLDGRGNPRGPQMFMRFSDDGSHTFSSEQTRDCGQAGQFKARAIWRRLGRSRDRVYEISVTDPIDWSITEAYLEVSA